MSKRRDAETGKYISEEESETKDKKTWVEEHDKHTDGDRLILFYLAVKDRTSDTGTISLDTIKEELTKLGIHIDENGNVSTSKK